MSLNMAFNLNTYHVVTYPVLERTGFKSYRGTGDLQTMHVITSTERPYLPGELLKFTGAV